MLRKIRLFSIAILNLLFWLLVAALFLKGIFNAYDAICPIPASLAPDLSAKSNCIEFWINRYQTLIAGLSAVLVGALTISATRQQIMLARELSDKKEAEAERAFRAILIPRMEILAEFWKFADWALETPDPEERERRAPIANSIGWHPDEHKKYLNSLNSIRDNVALEKKVKISNICIEIGNYVDFLEENRARSDAKKIDLLRIRFAFIHQALERYDPSISDIFVGCGLHFINPGHSASTVRAVRESLIQSYLNGNNFG